MRFSALHGLCSIQLGDIAVFWPNQVAAGHRGDTYYKIAIRTIEVGLPIAWMILIYTQIIKPVRQYGFVRLFDAD